MTNNNLGIKTFLVEECQKVKVQEVLKKYRINLKETLLRSAFEMTGAEVRLTTSQTGNAGTRFWFVCPNCKRRVGILLTHPLQRRLGCRQCLNLEYKKRRFKGMLESKIIE